MKVARGTRAFHGVDSKLLDDSSRELQSVAGMPCLGCTTLRPASGFRLLAQDASGRYPQDAGRFLFQRTCRACQKKKGPLPDEPTPAVRGALAACSPRWYPLQPRALDSCALTVSHPHVVPLSGGSAHQAGSTSYCELPAAASEPGHSATIPGGHDLRPAAAAAAGQPPAPGPPHTSSLATSHAASPSPAPIPPLSLGSGVIFEQTRSLLEMQRHLLANLTQLNAEQLVLLGSQQQPALPAHQPREGGATSERGVGVAFRGASNAPLRLYLCQQISRGPRLSQPPQQDKESGYRLVRTALMKISSTTAPLMPYFH